MNYISGSLKRVALSKNITLGEERRKKNGDGSALRD